jgi:crossover junction endodeoxyribonuclease RuvC
MKILGIDPGLQVCGYACLETNGKEKSPTLHSYGDGALIEAGVCRTSGGLPLEAKLNQIAEDMQSLLEKFGPDIVAVEELYSHYAHPKTAILMGHARGVILQSCAEAGIELRSFSATRIKKSITGSGKASKQQMQRAIQGLLSLPALPEPDDVADAIAAALCCANSVGTLVTNN